MSPSSAVKSLKLDVKPYLFTSVNPLYKTLYEASQMFCFRTHPPINLHPDIFLGSGTFKNIRLPTLFFQVRDHIFSATWLLKLQSGIIEIRDKQYKLLCTATNILLVISMIWFSYTDKLYIKMMIHEKFIETIHCTEVIHRNRNWQNAPLCTVGF